MHSNIMKASIFTPFRGRWGLPLLFWGMPGTAKTKFIEEICRRYGLPYETLSPSERGEGAFGVVPVPDKADDEHAPERAALAAKLRASKKVPVTEAEAHARALAAYPMPETLLTYPRPEWTEKFFRAGNGVVFVDEVTSTAPALQAPLMGLILERRIGGAVLPPGVRMLAAANPVEIAAGGFDLSAPLANRLGHIEWAPPTVDEHVQYMLRGSSDLEGVARTMREIDEDINGVSKDTEEEETAAPTFDVAGEEGRVLKLWPNAWAQAVGLETAFLRARPGLKNKMPENGAAVGRAWPSDRSWDFACHALASGHVHALSQQEREVFIEAFIGASTASEWFEFMEKQDLPDPAKLLDGREKFTHEKHRLDRTVAVLQSCVALVAPMGADKRNERGEALWSIIDRLVSGDAMDQDIVVPTVQSLVDSRLIPIKIAQKPLSTLNALLKRANIQRR